MNVREVVDGVRPIIEEKFGKEIRVWGRGPSMVSFTIGVWGGTVRLHESSTPESVADQIINNYIKWVKELPPESVDES